MKKNEQGIAHAAVLGVLVIALVVGAGYMVMQRQDNKTNNSADDDKSSSLVAPLPNDLLTVEAVKALAVKETPTAELTSVELEQENGTFLYKVKLADGKILFFNAKTGEKVTHDAGETETEDGTIPAGFVAAISYDKAREIALGQKAGGTITKIELESEEGKVVYVVRFSDEARIYVDATSGAVVKTKPAKTTDKTTTNTSTSTKPSDDSSTSSNDDSKDDDSGSSNSGSGSSGSGSNSGSDDKKTN